MISGPAVYPCPWCGRSVEQGESCWCKQSQKEAMTRQEIRAALKGARADNVRLEAENVRLASMLGEEAKRRKEADAENARLLEAGNNLRSFAVPGMDWTDEIARAALDGWDALKPAGGE